MQIKFNVRDLKLKKIQERLDYDFYLQRKVYEVIAEKALSALWKKK